MCDMKISSIYPAGTKPIIIHTKIKRDEFKIDGIREQIMRTFILECVNGTLNKDTGEWDVVVKFAPIDAQNLIVVDDEK